MSYQPTTRPDFAMQKRMPETGAVGKKKFLESVSDQLDEEFPEAEASQEPAEEEVEPEEAAEPAEEPEEEEAASDGEDEYEVGEEEPSPSGEVPRVNFYGEEFEATPEGAQKLKSFVEKYFTQKNQSIAEERRQWEEEVRRQKEEAERQYREAQKYHQNLQAWLNQQPKEIQEKWNRDVRLPQEHEREISTLKERLERFEKEQKQKEAENQIQMERQRIEEKFKLPDGSPLDRNDLWELAAAKFLNSNGAMDLEYAYQTVFSKALERTRGQKASYLGDKNKTRKTSPTEGKKRRSGPPKKFRKKKSKKPTGDMKAFRKWIQGLPEEHFS